MNKLLLLIGVLAIVMGVADAHIYRDHWMKQNNINIDYMHYKAIGSRSKAAVLKERIKVDDISAKEIDFSSVITDKIINIQRFLFGFLNGTATIGANNICSGAMMNWVDSAFDIINYRFVWLPEYTMKYQQASTDMTTYQNTAYAYCNFNQMFVKITELFSYESGSAIGRMYSRVMTSMIAQWWYKANCIVDGFLGENFYDIGYCTGQLFTVTFDVSLG